MEFLAINLMSTSWTKETELAVFGGDGNMDNTITVHSASAPDQGWRKLHVVQPRPSEGRHMLGYLRNTVQSVKRARREAHGEISRA